MTTQAKFKCQNIIETKYQGGKATKIILTAVTAYNSPDDKPFWDATPAGTIEINVANEAAVALFVPGKDYTVDFTPVEPTK